MIDVARHVVRCAARVGGKYSVHALGQSGVQVANWADAKADIDEDAIVIQVDAMSKLPWTPAGQLATIQELINSGQIPAADALEMIAGKSDLAAYVRRCDGPAPPHRAQPNLAHIIRTGEYLPPEPQDNHGLALKLVTEAIADARLDHVPESTLRHLRTYSTVTEAFLKPPAPPAPPMGGAGPMPAPAPGGPMPDAPPPTEMPLPQAA